MNSVVKPTESIDYLVINKDNSDFLVYDPDGRHNVRHSKADGSMAAKWV